MKTDAGIFLHTAAMDKREKSCRIDVRVNKKQEIAL